MPAPRLERSIQKRFFELARRTEAGGVQNRIETYQGLVAHRFYEVLGGAFPILRTRVSDAAWAAAVEAFVADKPKSPYIWESPKEFMRFIQRQKLLGAPWLADLMWFEWMEIELIMTPDEMVEQTAAFNWGSMYRLCAGTRLKSLAYAVYREDFETAGQYPLLMYCHAQEHAVYYLEITPFLFDMLMELRHPGDPVKILRKISRRYDVPWGEARDLLDGPLRDFVNNGVLLPLSP